MYIDVYNNLKWSLYIRRDKNMKKCGKNEGEVKSCLYFTISRLFRVVNKVAEEAFGELDICPTHAFLMIILQDEPEGMSVNKISEALTIAPSTVTRFVDKLISKQYVERIKIGKQSFTKITSEGREIMPRIYEAWDRIFENIENLVDDKNYLKEMSTRIRDFTDLIEENHKKGI